MRLSVIFIPVSCFMNEWNWDFILLPIVFADIFGVFRVDVPQCSVEQHTYIARPNCDARQRNASFHFLKIVYPV